MNKSRAGDSVRRGQAMTEFALLLPAMIFLVFGIFEAGRLFYVYSALANAAREGARYGITHASSTTAIRSRVVDSSPQLGISTSDVTVTCVPSNSCIFGNKVSVTVAYDYVPLTPLLPTLELQRVATMRIESP